MKIDLSTSKGRTKIATEIECDFEDEQDWQEFMLEVFNFLETAGVKLPSEISDVLDDYYD